jgi:membrane protease YdiL (CAAX protease family)
MRRELIAWPVFAAAIGLLLGTMLHWTGALLAPILTHVTVNALNLRFICRPEGSTASP